jgi:hypothetical protein
MHIGQVEYLRKPAPLNTLAVPTTLPSDYLGIWFVLIFFSHFIAYFFNVLVIVFFTCDVLLLNKLSDSILSNSSSFLVVQV